MKNSIRDQIKKAILEAARAAFPQVGLQLSDIALEHPGAEEHGDYSSSIALKIKNKIEKIKNPREIAGKIVALLSQMTSYDDRPDFLVFVHNIERFWEEVNQKSYLDASLELPVGAFSKGVVKLLGGVTPEVWLRSLTFGKIRGWRESEGFAAHPEVSRSYFWAIPWVLFSPKHLIRDRSESGRYLVVGELDKHLTLVVEVGISDGRNWLVTAFLTRERYLKRREKDCLEHKKIGTAAGTAVPPILAPAVRRDGGSRFSTLQDTQRFYSTLGDKSQEKIWEKVEIAAPGFINFWLSPKMLIREIGIIGEGKDKYGGSEEGKGKTVVIDYSSPNIAKAFSIGHLRSTIIGQALYDLYKFQGFRTIGDNHLGDWGTQFGKLLYMIDQKKKANFTLDDLERWYVEFHELAGKDPNLEERGRKWFKKLEEGDATARELWNKCVDISMKEFNRIYDLLGVKIDYAYGESFYEDLMGGVIAEAKNKGIARESDGAWTIDIPGQKTPLLLVKSDGTTTYATRDLATLKFRQRQWDPDIIIYEVGAEQALHFLQVFAAARMLGYVKESAELIHTKHGLYRWEHGKMRTRQGDTVKLKDILKEAVTRAKNLGKDVDESTARAVGIGAVKYFDLKHHVQSDIIFDWEKMFNLEGDSGPYLQYTFARAQSVLRKAQELKLDARSSKLGIEARKSKIDKEDQASSIQPLDLASIVKRLSSEEISVLRYLYRFPEVVGLAARTYSPNLICPYLFELAKRFNNFYNNIPILQRTDSRTTAIRHPSSVIRLQITEATSIVLKNGLTLLGIEALERM